MALTVRNYIDGRWVAGSGPHFESINPSTGEVLASAPLSGAEEVASAVAAARRAFDVGDWRWRKGSVPCSGVGCSCRCSGKPHCAISMLIASEMGKPMRVEIAPARWKARSTSCGTSPAPRACSKARSPVDHSRNMGYGITRADGVAALIIPWNDPVDLAVRKLGAALAAGCTTVVKSSEITPASTAALIEAVHDCGAFPAGVVNLLHGPGDPTGDALVASAGVDKISFTGSTATGIAIMRRAAERLAKVSLECGGKLPALIFPDADLDRCLDAVTFGAFMYSGQSCTACTRLIVHRSNSRPSR